MLISFKDVLTKNQIMIDSDTVRELIADEQGTDFQVHAEICHKLEIYYVSKEDYFRIIDNILNKSSSINLRILDSIITDLNNRILDKSNTIKKIYKFVNPNDRQKQQAYIEEIKVEELNYMLGIVEEYKKYASNN